MTILYPSNECPERSVERRSSFSRLASSHRRAAAAAVVIWVLAIGCRPAEPIHTYDAPKETGPLVMPDAAVAEPTDRMLAAILPDGEKAWFFKAVASLADINQRADQLTEFFANVRLAAERSHPDWRLADGWEEQPGSGVRTATITIPTSGKPLELSVTSLPWSGAQADLLSNVNRWRGQLQLAPIGPQGLDDCTYELAAGDAMLTIVDLRGRMQGAGTTPPFAAGGLASAGGAGGIASDSLAAPQTLDDMSAAHSSFSGSGVADHLTVKYESPDGWQVVPASGIRKVTFRIEDDAREAMVTVIAFSAAAGPLMADPLANVNRWRSEVGLAPLAADDLSAATAQIQVDRFQAIYVEAIPDVSKSDEPSADRGTLAAMATGDDVVWFFKITGDRDLVVSHRDQFKSFLKSVHIQSLDAPGHGA